MFWKNVRERAWLVPVTILFALFGLSFFASSTTILDAIMVTQLVIPIAVGTAILVGIVYYLKLIRRNAEEYFQGNTVAAMIGWFGGFGFVLGILAFVSPIWAGAGYVVVAFVLPVLFLRRHIIDEVRTNENSIFYDLLNHE